MPQLILKQPGQIVADFYFAGTEVVVAGVVIDCAQRESETAQVIEIRQADGTAHEGGDGAFLAQIDIPARRYDEEPGPDNEEGGPTTVSVPVPLDPNRVTVTLWPAN